MSQKKLFAGMDCLPGQLDLFPTDGQLSDSDDDCSPSLDEWLEGWERAVLDGQSNISREEAIRRFESEVDR